MIGNVALSKPESLVPIVIAGPTASGKSEIALSLAEKLRGCIVNADALQVYGCWRVLTARPDATDLARAPHALYGHVACVERYSVGAWLRDVAAVLVDLRAQGLRPIIVGGTGLYFAALFEGLSPVPEIAPEVRAASALRFKESGLAAMCADLERLDPVTLGLLDRSNPRRVQRAWDVVTATGRGLSDWQRQISAPLLDADRVVRVVVCPEKASLNNRIETRFHRMMEAGALDECRAVRDAGIDATLPSAQALGFVQLAAHLDGRCTLDEAISRAVIATRQYAKRQRSWLRSRMADWQRVDPGGVDAVGTILARVAGDHRR